MNAAELTERALAIVALLDPAADVDAATILTLALALVLAAAPSAMTREQTADVFRVALLDQMLRLDGRAARGETAPS